MAEGSETPRKEEPEIIRYFGERKKIFLIHFRNIVGDRNKFQEVWPDEGVITCRYSKRSSTNTWLFRTTHPGIKIRRTGGRDLPSTSVTSKL